MSGDAGYWLPLIAAGVIALAVALYVVLDGFDLGIGILFPFFSPGLERDSAMNSVAPVWDGNETWLVLGGGGMFVAFPKAYAVIMPAFYLPVIVMLLALVLRGVAFEFRRVSVTSKGWWNAAFAFGSTLAALSQGVMLGGLLESRFQLPAAIDFAFRAPFVNYWRARTELSTQGLVFSKMPGVQQIGMTTQERSALLSSLPSIRVRVATRVPTR